MLDLLVVEIETIAAALGPVSKVAVFGEMVPVWDEET
jgi:hypothetical protein